MHQSSLYAPIAISAPSSTASPPGYQRCVLLQDFDSGLASLNVTQPFFEARGDLFHAIDLFMPC